MTHATHHHRARGRALATATSLVLLTIATAACADTTTTGTTAVPSATASTARSVWAASGQVDDVDRADPQLVSQAFAEALFSYDTTRDDSTLDAAARACALATDTLTTDLTATERAAGNGWWWQAAEHQATARVRIAAVEDAGLPETTEQQAYAVWSVRWWMTGTDGWSGAVTENAVYVTMDAGADGWTVSQASIR
ncbi:MAG TPA: hypothetical protein VGC67_11795 [Cellulomonas sp.]